MLIPPILSGPFLLVKPQDALGYWISFRRVIFVRALLVTLVLLLVSLLIWGVWPLRMYEAIRLNTLGRSYNLAPIALIPWWLSVAVGLYISWGAFRRRDPIAAILGWLFFVPYITYYALLLPFGLFAIRFPRIALLISAVMWIVFGGIIVVGIVRGL